ncbi:hypothetical protein MGU_01200 [Metarhizium guizhouense ARSEF 977]|uniref:Uncharacterized protein n=1 Tax=Metarhizium guizhouense (strain ARSEF 977) TaxID=1276136 RepID=A0A0B4ICC3_METGA|nr:hypothetical protein MGU_01200 [Metarhizium guizhouense ARSEF 977]
MTIRKKTTLKHWPVCTPTPTPTPTARVMPTAMPMHSWSNHNCRHFSDAECTGWPPTAFEMEKGEQKVKGSWQKGRLAGYDVRPRTWAPSQCPRAMIPYW